MQTQVSNGRTGRPKFTTSKPQSAMSKAMTASWARRRAAARTTPRNTEAVSIPPFDKLDFKWAHNTASSALTEIDAMITVRQTELDQLRAVRAMLTATQS